MIVKLLSEHHLEFQSLRGGCTGSSESTLVKMPHCWKSHATANRILVLNAYAQSHSLNAHAQLSSVVGGLSFCLSPARITSFMYTCASNEMPWRVCEGG